MGKKEFRTKELPGVAGSYLYGEDMNRINSQVPTGEDLDGSSPLLYVSDSGAANAYVVDMCFGIIRSSDANDSVTANKLVDSGADFVTDGVKVGDTVLNLDDATSAEVTAIDSATQLSLDADIFTAQPKNYAVGPDILQLPATLKPGQVITFVPGNVNTGASTLDVNSLGVKSIKHQAGGDVIAGELPANRPMRVLYDGTNFVLLSSRAGSGCSVKNAAAQTISKSTWTVLNFDTEEWDDESWHDSVTNNSRVTLSSAGRFEVCAVVELTNNESGDHVLDVKKNGASYGRRHSADYASAGGIGYVTVSYTFEDNYAAGDYLELAFYYNSTSASRNTVPANTRLQVRRVR